MQKCSATIYEPLPTLCPSGFAARTHCSIHYSLCGQLQLAHSSTFTIKAAVSFFACSMDGCIFVRVTFNSSTTTL
eukprot:6470888-Amphidinium_carterae.1